MKFMNAENTFNAPWGRSVKIVTGLVAVMAIALVLAGIARPAQMPVVVRLSLILGPPLVMGATALFAVRGYRIGNGEIEIERLGWSTHLSLDLLKSATVDSGAMRRSIRLAGDGGLFAIVGWYWNRKLRKYRAFATDPKRSVVLKFADRTVVVTPDNPERFVEAIRERSGITGTGERKDT